MAEVLRIGLVLAGGASRRMGVDKAWLDWRGVPAWEHMERILKNTGISEVWFSRSCGQRFIPGRTILWDDKRRGPLPAVRGALARAKDSGADGLLVTAVDMPRLRGDWLKEWVFTGALKTVVCAVSDHGREPFGSWIPCELLPDLLEVEMAGVLGLKGWFDGLPAERRQDIFLDDEDLKQFWPGNSLAEWESLQK